MASRIISVTFEATTQARRGAFSIPRPAADLLGIRADDPVELRITWEGGKLEIATSPRSGLEVYPRTTDDSTDGLAAIAPNTPITVTVWRSGEGDTEEDGGSSVWTDDRFDVAFVAAGGPVKLLQQLRGWARDHDVALRYGKGAKAGPLHFDAPGTDPPITLISVGATNGIEWVFRNNLDRSTGFRNRGTRIEFFRRIGELFEVDRDEASADTWFGVPASRLQTDEYAEFLSLLDEELELVTSGPSELRGQYHRFFTRVLARFQELRPGVTSTQRVATDNWLEFSAGRSGIRFSWSTAYRKYVRAELYIDIGKQADNKRIFDQLRKQSEVLEREVGQPISWERLDERRASRLAVYGKTPTDAFDTDDGLIEWAALTMAQMVDVLRPVVRGL